jgi:hypothetical protein
VFNVEKGSALFRRIVEAPVDICVIGVLAYLAQEQYIVDRSHFHEFAIWFYIFLLVTNIVLSKYSSSLIIERAAGTTIDGWKKFVSLGIFSVAIAIFSLTSPLYLHTVYCSHIEECSE